MRTAYSVCDDGESGPPISFGDADDERQQLLHHRAPFTEAGTVREGQLRDLVVNNADVTFASADGRWPLDRSILQPGDFPYNLERGVDVDVVVIPYGSAEYLGISIFWFGCGACFCVVGCAHPDALVLWVLSAVLTAVGFVFLLFARKRTVEFDRLAKVARTTKEIFGCFRFGACAVPFAELQGVVKWELMSMRHGPPVLKVKLATMHEDQYIHVQIVFGSVSDSETALQLPVLRWYNYLLYCGIISEMPSGVENTVLLRDAYPPQLKVATQGGEVDVATVPYGSYLVAGSWTSFGVAFLSFLVTLGTGLGLGLPGVLVRHPWTSIVPGGFCALTLAFVVCARKHIVEFDRSRRIVRTSKEMLGCYRFDRRSYDFSELEP